MNEATKERREWIAGLVSDLDASRHQFHSHRPEVICANALVLISKQLEVLLSRQEREPVARHRESRSRPEELPIQPLFRDAGGVRFVANEFVRWMVDEGKRTGVFTLDSLARLGYPDDHFAQLLMLIGYSMQGFETHAMVPDDVRERVAAEVAKFPPPRSEGA